MADAFSHLGNHLISDSASAINAGADDLSALDADDGLLFRKYGAPERRRRTDDDDNQTELYEDDDNDSLTSVPVDGMRGLGLRPDEDEHERELPDHACA